METNDSKRFYKISKLILKATLAKRYLIRVKCGNSIVKKTVNAEVITFSGIAYRDDYRGLTNCPWEDVLKITNFKIKKNKNGNNKLPLL